MKIEIASLSDIGQVRQKNEDAAGRFEPRNKKEQTEKGFLFVVADGMGGHRGGEIASKLAVDTIVQGYYDGEGTDSVALLCKSFERANQLIHDKATTEIDLFGMGTTCTAMVIKRGEAYFAHVGDSRAYVLRNSRLKQITQDHSLVGEMVRSGMLSNEDAQNHPKRNVITRSLGTHEQLVTDCPSSPYRLVDGDTFLLCSDGLTSLVVDSDMRNILDSSPPVDACQQLVDLANERGGKDNITVQIIKIHRKN